MLVGGRGGGNDKEEGEGKRREGGECIREGIRETLSGVERGGRRNKNKRR